MIRFSKSCAGCGRPIPAGAWCAWCADNDPDAPQRPAVEQDARRQHPGGHWSPDRDREQQGAFRARLVRIYGERCMAVGPIRVVGQVAPFEDLEPGRRCVCISGLQAHHGRDMPDMLLCTRHHKAVDAHAR